MSTVRAKEPFGYALPSGYLQNVGAGELFDSDDPCVRKRPQFFEPVEAVTARKAGRAVETASAGPGERRTRGRPPKNPQPLHVTDDVVKSDAVEVPEKSAVLQSDSKGK